MRVEREGGGEGEGERGRERGRGGEKGRYLSTSTVSRWSESRERERERERNRDIRDWMRLGTASLTISILQNIGIVEQQMSGPYIFQVETSLESFRWFL